MGLKTNKTTKTSRLNCQFIESFPLSDGNRKQLTLSEKQQYIDERLKSYNKKLGTAVCLEVSPEGISTLQVGAKTVTMAHPLQRVSYATVETSNKLFAYVSQPPGADTQMVCHTFLTKNKEDAVSLCAALNKLLKQTSAYSLKEGDKLGEAAEKRGTTRQWAKRQAADGHRDVFNARNVNRKVKQETLEVDNGDGVSSSQESTLPEKSSIQGSPEESGLASPSRSNHVNEVSSQSVTQVQSNTTNSTEASGTSIPFGTDYVNEAPALPPKSVKRSGMSDEPRFPEASNPTSPLPTNLYDVPSIFPEPTILPVQSHVASSPGIGSPYPPFRTDYMKEVPLSSPPQATAQPAQSYGPSSAETSSPYPPFRTDYMNEVPTSFPPQPNTQPTQSYGPSHPEASNPTSPFRTNYKNEGLPYPPQPTTQPAQSYGPKSPQASNPTSPFRTNYKNEVLPYPPQPTTQPTQSYGPKSPEASNPTSPFRTNYMNEVLPYPPRPSTQPAQAYGPSHPEASNPTSPFRTNYMNEGLPSFSPQPTTQPAQACGPSHPEASNPTSPFRTNYMNEGLPSFSPQPSTQPGQSYGPKSPEGSNPTSPRADRINNVPFLIPKPIKLPGMCNVPRSPELCRGLPKYAEVSRSVPRSPEVCSPTSPVRNDVPSLTPQPTTRPYVPSSSEVSTPFLPFGTENPNNVPPVLPKPAIHPPMPSLPTSPRKDNLLVRSESNPMIMYKNPAIFPNQGFSPKPVAEQPSEDYRLHRLNSAPSDMLSSYAYHPCEKPRRSSDSFPQQASFHQQEPGARNEDWYMPEASSDMVANMLGKMNFGCFIVRKSQSRPGCHILTVKISNGLNYQNGLVNYVIVPVKNGFIIEGTEKVFHDISTLIHHHVSQKDGLFCRLVLTRPQSSLSQHQWQHRGVRR